MPTDAASCRRGPARVMLTVLFVSFTELRAATMRAGSVGSKSDPPVRAGNDGREALEMLPEHILPDRIAKWHANCS